jgi:hypothetical protein
MDTCFHIPYLLWDKDPKESQLFFEKHKNNKIFETASLALNAQPPISTHKIAIPLDLKTMGEGYYFVCRKVFLVGKELLVLSQVEGMPSRQIKVNRIREKIVMKLPAEMTKGNNYEFIHFLLKKDDQGFEEINGIDDMVVCVIDDEEQFYHHLNLCAQIPDYIPLLKKKIFKKKFSVGRSLERRKVGQAEPGQIFNKKMKKSQNSWRLATAPLRRISGF